MNFWLARGADFITFNVRLIVIIFLPGYTTIEKWVVSTHWDAEVTTLALSLMSTLNRHKELLIYVLITNSVIHALCGLNLIIGGCLGMVLNNLSLHNINIFGHEQ